MTDIEIGYKSSTIASMSSSGSLTLNTAGKYCEDNITVTYDKVQGSAFTPATTISVTPTISIDSNGLITANNNGTSSITPTVTAGYITSGTAGTITVNGSNTSQLTTQAASTWTPTTTSQIISSGTYLTGNQTIAGDSNLVASNIASGVSIFGVNGTFQGGGDLESITVDTTKLLSQSTTIEDGWVGTVDLDGAFTSSSNQIFKYIGSFNHILFKINTTYQIYGAITLQHDNGDQEIYNINGTYKVGSSFSSIKDISFTWESSDCNQTFSIVKLNIQSNNSITLYFNGSYTGTLTGVNSSYLSFYTTGYDGYESITINLLDNPKFLNIYKSLAYRSTIYSSAAGVSEWINSLSKIDSNQFMGQRFSGDFVFSNVSQIKQYGFADLTLGGYAGASSCNFTFPLLSNFSDFAAFGCNRGLKNIYCPLVSYIGSSTFYSCSLRIASFPECLIIGSSAFTGCNKLTTISFPKCTTISSFAFNSCSNLTTISFPKCITISGYAFQSCTSLTTVSFPKCTQIGAYAFSKCTSLTTVSFPECTQIGSYAFNNCSNLTIVSFPECTQIGAYAFNICSNLTIVSFPECTQIGAYAFNNCSNLTIVSFPECTTISSSAFYNCKSLESAYFMGSSIPLIVAGLFNNTPIINSTYLGYFGSIYVPSSLLNSYKTATNWATYSARMVGI